MIDSECELCYATRKLIICDFHEPNYRLICLKFAKHSERYDLIKINFLSYKIILGRFWRGLPGQKERYGKVLCTEDIKQARGKLELEFKSR